MATAIETARHILSLMDTECGDTISNLKLQKLLYYSQGFHLAMTGDPLFQDEIAAWQHGPVCPEAWRKFNHYGSDAIPIEEAQFQEGESPLTGNQAEIVKEVYDAYGQFSAWSLRNRTHQEKPWLDHCDPNPTPGGFYNGGTIPQNELKEYFSTLLEDGD